MLSPARILEGFLFLHCSAFSKGQIYLGVVITESIFKALYKGWAWGEDKGMGGSDVFGFRRPLMHWHV